MICLRVPEVGARLAGGACAAAALDSASTIDSDIARFVMAVILTLNTNHGGTKNTEPRFVFSVPSLSPWLVIRTSGESPVAGFAARRTDSCWTKAARTGDSTRW